MWLVYMGDMQYNLLESAVEYSRKKMRGKTTF